MASEQFSLCWDNFHKNMSNGMQSLLENEDLVDVTLAVEGRYLKAHKMVLSVCSPYFRELFQSNPCKHPIVFMKDVSYIALSDLLQFMYQGEVQVSQENLSTFIKTAEALQIKGLTGDNNQDSDTTEQFEEARKVVEIPGKRIHETVTPKPLPQTRVKKLGGPAPKRLKITLPTVETAKVISTSTPASTKPEAGSSNISESDAIEFKLEPSEGTSEHTQVEDIDDSQVEKYVDDSMDDGHDDSDYNAMEATTDEPMAGTSADDAGNSQDNKNKKLSMDIANLLEISSNTPLAVSNILQGTACEKDADSKNKKRKKRVNTRMRFVVDGFVYHNNLIAGTPPLRYLGCAEHKRAACRGRATLPLHGTLDQLKVTQQHNHPPDLTAAEKYAFVTELKKAVQSMRNSSLKNIYESVAEIYPLGANEIPFKSISSSLHRWRNSLRLL